MLNRFFIEEHVKNALQEDIGFGDITTDYLTTEDDGVNWIKIGDVSPNDKYITKTNEKISKEGAKKSRFLHPGDFILSNSAFALSRSR